MLENLKIAAEYDGFLFLAEAIRNPPVLQPHRHIELELNLVVQGEITYVVGGRRFTFGPRTLLWMFPSQVHQLVDRTSDAQYYVAVFKPELIAQSCRGTKYAGLSGDRESGDGVLHTELDPVIYDLVRQSMEEITSGGLDPDVLNREAGFGISPGFAFRYDDPDWLNAGLRHLLLLCWRHQTGQYVTDRNVALHPGVSKALKLIGMPENEDDLEQLAKKCSVSASYLSRMFQQQVGVTITRYRNSVRLNRFWDYLARPERPTLLESVFAAGFGSYAQFYRVFTQIYGTGPRASLSHENKTGGPVFGSARC